MSIPQDLVGKVAIVTGGSRGLGKASLPTMLTNSGRAISEHLSNRGAHVVVNYTADAAKANELVEKIRSEGRKAIAVKADVSKVPEIRNLFAETIKEFGGLDILISNAGVLDTVP